MDKKIEETREFLQIIGMPKAQQADICCYWYTESASEFLKNNSNNQKANDLRAVISTLYRYKKIDDEGLKDMIRCSGKLDEESVQKFLRVYKSTMEDLIELLSEDDEIKGFIGEKCARTD